MRAIPAGLLVTASAALGMAAWHGFHVELANLVGVVVARRRERDQLGL